MPRSMLSKRAPVPRLRSNVLSEQVLDSKSGIGLAQFRPGFGFGYDFAVEMDPPAIKSPLGKGSYWWWGINGTWFWIDPATDLVFVGMIQNLNGSNPSQGTPPTRAMSYDLVYSALPDPKK